MCIHQKVEDKCDDEIGFVVSLFVPFHFPVFFFLWCNPRIWNWINFNICYLFAHCLSSVSYVFCVARTCFVKCVRAHIHILSLSLWIPGLNRNKPQYNLINSRLVCDAFKWWIKVLQPLCIWFLTHTIETFQEQKVGMQDRIHWNDAAICAQIENETKSIVLRAFIHTELMLIRLYMFFHYMQDSDDESKYRFEWLNFIGLLCSIPICSGSPQHGGNWTEHKTQYHRKCNLFSDSLCTSRSFAADVLLLNDRVLSASHNVH